MRTISNILESNKFWIIFIFILASIFRIFFLDNIEFKYDEAIATYNFVNFYNQPHLVEAGGMSFTTGTLTPPLSDYILIGMSSLSRHPQSISFFIALANAVMVVVFYNLIRRTYGNHVSLFASLIFATSPWTIVYSRKIWGPDLLMLFAVPISYFISSILLKTRQGCSDSINAILSRNCFLLFLFLALIAQAHASGIVLIIIVAIILLIFRVSIDLKSSAKGFFIGLIPLLPYLWRQLKSTPFCIDCQALFNYQTSERAERAFHPEILKVPFSLDSGVGRMFGQDYFNFVASNPIVNLLNIVFIFIGILTFIALVWIVVLNRKYLFLALFPTLVTFIYFVGKSNPYDYYLLIIYPFLLIAVGLFLKSLLDIKSNLVKTLVLTIFSTIILSNITFEVVFNKFLAEKKVIDGGYGQIFSVTEEYVNRIVEPYKYLSDYEQIKAYAYIFANNRELHPKLNDEAEHIKLGEYFAQKGRLDIAVKELEMGIEINPDNPSTRAVLAQVYMQTREFDKAKEQVKIIEKSDQNLSSQLNSKLEIIQSMTKIY